MNVARSARLFAERALRALPNDCIVGATGQPGTTALLRVATLATTVALAACASSLPEDRTATVTGRAIYSETAVVPPNSSLWIQLLDVSLQDVRAQLISETMIPLEGRRPPIEFRLAYQQEAINPARAYAVRATIKFGERLLFTTTESYAVLTRGAPGDVSVRLHSVRARSTQHND